MVPTDPFYYIQNYAAAGQTFVTSSSEHPVDALHFAELLHTDKGKDLYNCLVWGLEGVHYDSAATEEEPNRIVTRDYDGAQGNADSPYGWWNWLVGNTYYTLLNQSSVVGYQQSLFELNDNAVKSEALGFTYDPIAVNAEIAQLNAVRDEYRDMLESGTLENWEASYEEFLSKLETAGIQTVVDDVQAQLDAYVAAN